MKNKKQSNTIQERMKDPEYRKQWCEKAKKGNEIAAKNQKGKKHPKMSTFMKNQWENPEYRKKQIKSNREALSKIDKSAAGKKSRKYENEIAKKIIADKIYLPNEICDRIVVRNGKIYFIEIKRKNGKESLLRPKQLEFQVIAKEQYEVLYGD
jgi:hypothetical protein